MPKKFKKKGVGGPCFSLVLSEKGAECWLVSVASLYQETVEIVERLHKLNVDVFIASGNCTKICLSLAKKLSIPEIFVKPNADPLEKRDFIKMLDGFYGVVFMIGNDVNDVPAFKEADVSVLVNRERACKEVIEQADYVVKDLRGALRVIEEYLC